MPYVDPATVAKKIGKPALSGPPVDEHLQFSCDAAEFYINDWCGLAASIVPTPAPISLVALSLAIDLYKQPDATFGILGSGETGPVRIARDLLNRYDSLLIPFYDSLNGWGVA
jgi:hypothetical protein